jgi:hypothetical protein
MSDQVNTTATYKFQNNIEMVLQQNKSQLIDTVETQDATDEKEAIKDLVGNVMPQEANERHGDTKYVNTPHDRVWLAKPNELYYADLVDNADKLGTGINLEGEYTMAAMATLNRSWDDQILTGAYGSIVSGKEGTVTTPFPSGQIIPVTVGGASGAQRMNVAKLRAAGKLLDQGFNMPGEQRFMVIDAEQNDDLLSEIPATSSDFTGAFGGVFENGRIKQLLGWNFVHLELRNPMLRAMAQGLTVDGNGYTKNPFWVKSGIRLGIWQKVRTSIDRLPTKLFSTQVFAGTTVGHLLMALEPIYQSQVSPSAGGSLPMASPAAFGAGVGDAIDQVGDAVHTLNTAKRRVDEADQTVAAGAQFADLHAKLEAYKAGRKNGPADGYAADVTKQFQDGRDAILNSITSAQVRRQFAERLNSYGGDLSGSAQVQEAGQKAGVRAATAQQSNNLEANTIATAPYDPTGKALFDTIARRDTVADGLPMTPEQHVKVQQQWTAQLVSSHFQAGIRDDPHQALADLDGGKFNALLPPDEMEVLRRQARVASDRLDAQQRAAQAQQQSQALAGLQTTEAQYRAGRASGQQWHDLATGFRQLGKEKEAIAAEDEGTAIDASEKYRGATPEDRDARIRELAAMPERTPAQGSELRGLQGQQTYVDKLSTLDRVAYATGRAVPPLDPTDPASVAQRTKILTAALQYGGTGDYFQPQEAKQVKEWVSTGGTAQKAQAAHVIASAGQFAGRALDQVAGGDQTFRAAVPLVTLPNGDELFSDALKGPDALRAAPGLLTPGKDETGQPISPHPDVLFSSIVGRAGAQLPPAFVDGLKRNATNLYLADAHAHGITAFDPDLFRDAMMRAAGGQKTGRGWVGGIGGWQGSNVILPVGMAQSQFEQRLSRATGAEWGAAALNGPAVAVAAGDKAATARAMTSGEARSLVPVMVQPFVYALRDGNSYAVTKSGRQFLFDIRKLPGVQHGAAPAPGKGQPYLPGPGGGPALPGKM